MVQVEKEQSDSLEYCIRHRHSTRFFLPDPVSHDTLVECLKLAQFSPSNSNLQPWRLYIATGARLARLKDALSSTAESRAPDIPAIPDAFKHYRSELGHELYGPHGYNVDRDGAKAASARNYRFFDAPCAMVLCMPVGLARGDVMSVGAYLQTLTLALTEKGLGTCIQGSVVGYPDVLRKELELPDDIIILCGLAVGYAQTDNPVNRIVVERDEVDKYVVWKSD